MRFDSAITRLRRACIVVASSVLVAGGLLTGCADGFMPASAADTPEELSVVAIRRDAIRLTWKSVADPDVAAIIIERRVAFTGPFTEVAKIENNAALAQQTWTDSDISPETFYGYRIFAVTSSGDRSPASIVGGALAPPLPGLDILTNSVVTVSESLDPDGYEVLIMGPDTVRAGLATAGTRRFAPLRPGRYTVTLRGIIPRCAVVGSATKDVEVVDTTALTITPVAFEITCRDPSRGQIDISVAVTGDSLDNSFFVDVLGTASDTTLPASQRIFSRRQTVERAPQNATLRNLRPGMYDVTIDSIAGNCTLTGDAKRTVAVTPLGTATVNYAVVCRGAAPPPSNKPFALRSVWTPQAGPTGSTTTLDLQLDLTARPGQGAVGVQAIISFDAAVLRFVEATQEQLGLPTVNFSTPGEINFIAGRSGAGSTGTVRVGKFVFAVIGASGTSAATRTSLTKVSQSTAISITDSVRAVEDTFTVGTGVVTPPTPPPATNQPPVARAGGPYTGTVGVPLTLSGATSTDADGTIASYAWTFGDNTTGTGATPSKTYTAAGTYTARLTVTDNAGAPATAQATVTITAAGGQTNTPPIAEANGPYTVQAGTAITLSSAGSRDPDGTIATYAWNLGNSQSASGASPSVTYAAAGTYTITLTVTDNGGATSTDQATITVTASTPQPPPPPPPPAGTPLTWLNAVAGPDANGTIAITITLDLTTDLTDTPGPESLQSFAVDSLKWDPAVLQFQSFNFGPNITGSSNQSGLTAGRLAFRGTAAPAQEGLVRVATVRFRRAGTGTQSTTTSTFLGALQSSSSNNFFTYNSKTNIVEGRVQFP
jgi:PKD repeat protein